MTPLALATALLLIDPAAAEFRRLQVDWIAIAMKPGDLEAVLPREQAELIRLLGDPRHLVRTLAREELARRGDAVHEALCWGMRARDPNVAHECRLLRERLFACPACDGDGVCRACTPATNRYRDHCPGGCDWDRHCRRCDGTGDTRYLRARRVDDWGEVFEVLVPKDLF